MTEGVPPGVPPAVPPAEPPAVPPPEGSPPDVRPQAVLPVITCPHCGRQVPEATFCGACGADLVHHSANGARRHHAYAAFPDEPVFRLAVTSSLFPHLSHRAKAVFRAALGALVVVLVVLALAGVEAPAIAVSALGIPVLYFLYTYEIDDPTRASLRSVGPLVLVVEAGLGVGWGLLGGDVVNRALGPTLDFSLLRPSALAAAVAVPVVEVGLMVVPVVLARLAARGLDESLDGFALGALGALGFVGAATVTQLSPLVSNGQFSAPSFTGILTQVVIRGLSSPIVGAALVGLFGASLWSTARRDGPAGNRALSTVLVPLATLVVLEVGLGFADVARLDDPQLLVVHLAAVGVGLAAMRVGLHYVLLHEQGPSEIGPPVVCGHCHFVVPDMHFCPHCGVARRATARSQRAGGRLGPESTPEPATAERSWPTVVAGAPGVPIRAVFLAAPGTRRPTLRLRRRHLFGLLALALVVVSGVLVLVAVLLRPPPPRHCPKLFECGGPVAKGAVHNGPIYTSRQYGFSVEYGPDSGTQKSAGGIIVTYTGRSPDEQGQVEIAGATAAGVSATTVVSDVAQQIAPGATVEYAVPNPYIGGVPAVGEAYNVSVNGSSNSGGLDRLIVLAAVRGKLAIVVVDMGPYWRFSSSNTTEIDLNDHPSPADQYAALFADPVVNSVTWPSGAG